MSENADRSAVAAAAERAVGNRRLVFGASTLSLGVAAGALAFVYTQTQLIPPGVKPPWVLGLLFVTGAYVRPLAGNLSGSISMAVGASAIAFFVHVTAWLWPMTLLDLSLAQLIFLPAYSGLLGQAIIGWIFTFPATFLTGYLTYVLVAGFLRP